VNSSGQFDADRWEDLQMTRLLFGLSSEEETEFDKLAQTMPVKQSELFESVVASLDIAWSDPTSMPLPDHLRQVIRSRAIEELTIQGSASDQTSPVIKPASVRLSMIPWGIAAACMAITVLTVFTSSQKEPVKVASLDVTQQRDQFIASANDLVQAQWINGPTPIPNVEGDVAWSPSQQRGFMRFKGLTVNQPTLKQYQLWIFDHNQSPETPIDGGVFDVSTTGIMIVPINAKLHVEHAYIFAVTIEKPGGVVVSSRTELPLLAKLE
jgi:anti-sigma-K factor RskA